MMTIKIRNLLLLGSLCLLLLPSGRLYAATAPALIGEPATAVLRDGETLMELARRTGHGFQAVANANPGLDPWHPGATVTVTLPSPALLPQETATGLTINLAELRLFVLPSDPAVTPAVYPLGIGREGWETPEGLFRVTYKTRNPPWRVPASIRRENPGLPRVVPTGPDNPLGRYWLGLSVRGYGLHGTNRPLGVGRRISHGCMRFYPEHIRHLYETVPLGTPVRIVYQPVKAARVGDQLLLEAHPDYLDRHPDLFQEALRAISRTGWPGDVDYARVSAVVKAATGLPVPVGRLPSATKALVSD